MTAMVALVDALAAYRLTRLVTADTITRDARDAVVDVAYGRARRVPPDADLRPSGAFDWTAAAQEDDEAPMLATLVTCRWCASVWVGLGVVAARRFAPRLWSPIARALALSAVAVWAAHLEDG